MVTFDSPEKLYGFLKINEQKSKENATLRAFLDIGDTMKNPGTCSCIMKTLGLRFHNSYLQFASIDESTKSLLKSFSSDNINICYGTQSLIQI